MSEVRCPLCEKDVEVSDSFEFECPLCHLTGFWDEEYTVDYERYSSPAWNWDDPRLKEQK